MVTITHTHTGWTHVNFTQCAPTANTHFFMHTHTESNVKTPKYMPYTCQAESSGTKSCFHAENHTSLDMSLLQTSPTWTRGKHGVTAKGHENSGSKFQEAQTMLTSTCIGAWLEARVALARQAVTRQAERTGQGMGGMRLSFFNPWARKGAKYVKIGYLTVPVRPRWHPYYNLPSQKFFTCGARQAVE